MAEFKFIAKRYMGYMEGAWKAFWEADLTRSAMQRGDKSIYGMLGKEKYVDRSGPYLNANVFSGGDKTMLKRDFYRWRPQNYASRLRERLKDQFATLGIAALNIRREKDEPAKITKKKHITSENSVRVFKRLSSSQRTDVWSWSVDKAYKRRDYFRFFNSNPPVKGLYRVIVNFKNQQGGMLAAHHFDDITADPHTITDYRNSIRQGKIYFGNHTDTAPEGIKCDKMVLYLNDNVSDSDELYDFCDTLNTKLTTTLGVELEDNLSAFYVQTHKGIGCAPELGNPSYTRRNATLMENFAKGKKANPDFPSYHSFAMSVYEEWSKTPMAGLANSGLLR